MVGLVTEAFAFVGVVSDPGTELVEDCYYFLPWGCSILLCLMFFPLVPRVVHGPRLVFKPVVHPFSAILSRTSVFWQSARTP